MQQLKRGLFWEVLQIAFCIRSNSTTTRFAFCQNSKLIFTFLSRTSSSRFGKGHRLWFWVSLQLICNLKKSWLCHLVSMSKWCPKILFWWNLKFERLYLILDWRAILMQIKKYIVFAFCRIIHFILNISTRPIYACQESIDLYVFTKTWQAYHIQIIFLNFLILFLVPTEP